MSFKITSLEIPDVKLIEPQIHRDSRGFFLETYKESDFNDAGITTSFVQDNWSHSLKGVLRGLHYQKQPEGQAKLVSVLRGDVYDVAVDLRSNSRTFGAYVGVRLSGDDYKMLYIPNGFAHGFCVLSDEADFVYKVSAQYSREHDKGIIWNDPGIQIDWPVKNPLLSEKDLNLPTLEDADINF